MSYLINDIQRKKLSINKYLKKFYDELNIRSRSMDKYLAFFIFKSHLENQKSLLFNSYDPFKINSIINLIHEVPTIFEKFMVHADESLLLDEFNEQNKKINEIINDYPITKLVCVEDYLKLILD